MFDIGPAKSDESDLVDPVQLVKQAINANLDATVFTERQVETAPNVIEWCSSHRFLNTSDPLWARQADVLARFFADVCYHCSDIDYIHNVPVDDSLQDVLDRFCLLEHGVCPRCKRNRTEVLDEWIKHPKYARYHNWQDDINIRAVPPNEFIGIWGQRSGKSFATASFAWTYVLHRYLAIPSITNYFRLQSNTVLEAAFVAPTKDQVNTYMWTPFKNAYDTSPWFRDYVAFLKEEEKKAGLPLYHRQQTYIAFPSKRIVCTMKAANSGTLRGGTRLWASCDELGWFNVDEHGKRRAGIKEGSEVFTSLKNSLLTIRTQAEKRRKQLNDFNVIDGYMFCISSPSSIADAIEKRGAIADRSPRMFFTRYPTWEVNPNVDKDTLWEEDGADPIKFKRDYCAQPPRAAAPFIEPGPFQTELVEPIKTNYPLLTYKVDIASDVDSGVQLLRPTLQRKVGDRTTPRVLTVDNGERKNSFALCLASFYPEHEGVLYEEFLEVAPYPNHIVDLQWCYDELIVHLVRHFNIVQVGYDRWESSYAVRDLRTNYHIDATRYSLKWKDFKAFRDDLRASRTWFAKPEINPDELLQTNNLQERARYPRAHFIVQLTTVNEFGKSVQKPDGGNDDLFRCGVLAHYLIMNNRELYEGGHRFGRGGIVSGKGSAAIFVSNRGRSANRGRSHRFAPRRRR